jgi:hypothetical protein
MVFSPCINCIRWSTLYCQLPRRQSPSILAYDNKVPCIVSIASLTRANENVQLRILFSSGQAQINGGGAFCMARYSYITSAGGEVHEMRSLPSGAVLSAGWSGRKEDKVTYPLLRYFCRHLAIGSVPLSKQPGCS